LERCKVTSRIMVEDSMLYDFVCDDDPIYLREKNRRSKGNGCTAKSSFTSLPSMPLWSPELWPLPWVGMLGNDCRAPALA